LSDILIPGDLAGAYAVQAAQKSRWLGAGRRLIGRKVDLTAKAEQMACDTNHPVHGSLYADMEVADGDVLAPGTLLQPRAEGEVAFVLSRDLAEEEPTIVDIIRAVEFVLPAIDIIDSRIAGLGKDAVDMIADNASAGGYVLGAEPKVLAGLDLRMCGMVMEKNGQPASVGAGLNCLGHPLHSLRWAAREMLRQGCPLRAGEIVLSGPLGPMVLFGPGDFIEVYISGVGSVSLIHGKAQDV
jgi:2-keto-4-pentenoate hydratase